MFFSAIALWISATGIVLCVWLSKRKLANKYKKAEKNIATRSEENIRYHAKLDKEYDSKLSVYRKEISQMVEAKNKLFDETLVLNKRDAENTEKITGLEKELKKYAEVIIIDDLKIEELKEEIIKLKKKPKSKKK